MGSVFFSKATEISDCWDTDASAWLLLIAVDDKNAFVSEYLLLRNMNCEV